MMSFCVEAGRVMVRHATSPYDLTQRTSQIEERMKENRARASR
jgi:hypothetical protein